MLQLIVTELHQDEPPRSCQVFLCPSRADFLVSAQTDAPFRQALICAGHVPATMRRLGDVVIAHLECQDIPGLVSGE